MSKLTQYEMILNHLRKAGRAGATVHQLSVYSNSVWKRIEECTYLRNGVRYVDIAYSPIDRREEIVYDWVERDGRRLRLYRLVRVK